MNHDKVQEITAEMRTLLNRQTLEVAVIRLNWVAMPKRLKRGDNSKSQQPDLLKGWQQIATFFGLAPKGAGSRPRWKRARMASQFCQA